VLLVTLGTFLRGPNWNFFGPYEYWDLHKLLALNNVNLSEYFWVKMLHTKLPTGTIGKFVRELPGIILVVFTVIALTMDNFLRPFLIKRGADLPLLLILVGVIGGLLAFGLLGLFLGPVMLAITYTLLQNWIADTDADAPAADHPAELGENSQGHPPARSPAG